jgi:peptide-methionine (S)-S-oxide reductase
MKNALLSSILLAACSSTASHAAVPVPAPKSDLPADGAKKRTAVFAAGCFWCVEAVFEGLSGVEAVVSGYAGGDKSDADYEEVSSGGTKHAEVVQITYDPSVISYGTLLHVLFSTHDPTTKDRQGPDHGAQYRSAIFCTNDAEKKTAESYIAQLNGAKAFSSPIVTTLEPLTVFHPAEAYHQDFVARNPSHGYVRQWALPKLEKLKKLFPDRLRK